MPGLYTVELGDDVLGWLGLNRATHKTGGSLLVNPVVGVRNQKLERVVAQLCDTKFHAYIPPSISTGVGFLMPEQHFLEWTFSPEHDPTATASELVQAVQQFGLPFMRANADLQQLLNTMMHSRFGIPDQLVYRIPVALMMLGQTKSAEAEVDKELARLADADYPAADNYRKFANAFLNVEGSQCNWVI